MFYVKVVQDFCLYSGAQHPLKWEFEMSNLNTSAVSTEMRSLIRSLNQIVLKVNLRGISDTKPVSLLLLCLSRRNFWACPPIWIHSLNFSKVRHPSVSTSNSWHKCWLFHITSTPLLCLDKWSLLAKYEVLYFFYVWTEKRTLVSTRGKYLLSLEESSFCCGRVSLAFLSGHHPLHELFILPPSPPELLQTLGNMFSF